MPNPRPNFQNTEIAFQRLSNLDLHRSLWLFRSMDIKPFVVYGPKLVNAAFKMKLPISCILKETVFKQFCGGETLEACKETMNLLMGGKVYSILDYGAEGENSEAGFERATQEVLKTIESTKNNKNAPFCVFKFTAIARFELLEILSLNDESKITPSLLDEWKRVENRAYNICKTAIDAGKLVMIDAEETWIQSAIDKITLDMMRKYNSHNAKVFTTIQMYRKSGIKQVTDLLSTATREGWVPGIKLVRGAYMEKERERAVKLGYESPIQNDKAATDRDYDLALNLILSHPTATICAGTHNEPSISKLIDQMDHRGIQSNSSRVWFSQLLGMSDHLTFNLSKSGYSAAKYVPYGPVKLVLPYLFRRAQENSSIAGQSGREYQLIVKEIKRRNAAPNS